MDQLKKYLDLDPSEEEGIRNALKMLRMAITPYYLSLIDKNNPHCPIRKQAVPSALELHKASADLEDPLHEDSDSPVPGLTHRYPDQMCIRDSPATVPNLCWLVNAIPAGSTWTATGIGRHAFTLAAPAIAMGGNVRVGFEDNLYLERGVLAKSNGELVAKVVRIAKELGRPIATSAEAREILGLKPLK